MLPHLLNDLINHNMPTTTTRDNDILFWQENKDVGVPEPAILIQPFDDAVFLETAQSNISLNWDSLPEFIKILKTLKRPS
jgi:hypothetical protein